MDSVSFDSEEPLSDHVPDGAVVENVKYNGDTETVEYVVPGEFTEDYLSGFERGKLYRIGNDLGVDLNWSGEEADTTEEMISKIVETVEEE